MGNQGALNFRANSSFRVSDGSGNVDTLADITVNAEASNQEILKHLQTVTLPIMESVIDEFKKNIDGGDFNGEQK